MKNRIIVRSICLCAALLGSNLSPAWAANVIKRDTPTMSNGASDWSAAPGPTDVGEFNGTVSVANLAAMTLGGAVSLGGLQFDGTMQGPLTLSDSSTLTLGASGIDMSAANQSVTLGCPMVLGADQNWNVTNGMTLTVSGQLLASTADTLTLTGSGTNNFSNAANGTYAGNVSVNGGTLIIGGANGNTSSAIGTGIITNNGATLLTAGKIVGNVLVFNGTNIIDANLSSVFTLDGAWQGSGTVIITNMISGATVTAGGNGNGGGSMANFTGSVIVSGVNRDGSTTAGNFRFNNGGSSLNLGNAAMTLDLGQGSAHFTEKNSNQTTSFGALFGGPNTQLAQPEYYVIGGLNLANDTFSGTSTGAASTFTKNGTGQFTWNNTNANTYTGTTTVNSGILQIGDGVTVGAGSLGSGAIVIAGGALVYNKPADFAVTNAISGSGGTLVKTNTDTMTYYGADTASSPTVISQGTLALGVGSVMSSPVSVASGATFDVSQNSAFTLNQALSGSGIVNGLLTAVGGSISPGNPGTVGTLAINGGLTEGGSVNNQFVLSQVGGTNDLLTVNGNLTVSGLNTITLSEFGGGVVPPGVYPLISYTGTLTGGTTNFSVSAIGFSGIVTNITSVTPNEIAVIVTAAVRSPLSLTWVGDGGTNYWDLTSTNWLNGGTKYVFMAGDSAIFTDSGSVNPPVNLQGTVYPASVVVSNTTAKHYAFTGSGGIGGTGGLTKTNSGLLTLLATNSYTGPTVIGGGVLELQNGATSGSASPIGAASSDPANLVFYGTTLRYSAPATNAMDHGLTMVGGVTVDVTNAAGAFAVSGVVTGSGGLTKVGPGTLAVQGANSYTGGTVISNGLLAMGDNNANWNGGTASGVGSTNSPVTFMGTNVTLQLFGWLGYTSYTTAFNNFYNPLVVSAGQIATLQLPGRGNPATGSVAGLNSSLTGSGTLNLVANYVRYPLSGNWSAFTGQINVTGAGFPNAGATYANNVDELRINNTYGYANAAIYLYGSTAPGNQNSPQSTLVMCQTASSGATIDIGELGSDPSAPTPIIGTGTGSAGNTTWRVGWKNTTNIFYGVIGNDGAGVTSITKVGTGKWILAGVNTYSGSTTISNGVLALITNPNTYNDASIANSANILINTNAILDVSALSSQALTLTTNTLGGGGTLIGSVMANSGANINPGSAVATGTLKITGGLTEMGGVNNNFQLTNTNPNVINVQGGLNVSSGIQNIYLSGFGTNAIAPGTYPLFTYTGGFNGTLNNFFVSFGANAYSGTLTNITTTTPPEIAVIVGSPSRPAANVVWKGDGVANNWDTVGKDWLVGGVGTASVFEPGDSVFFSDVGAANTNVTLPYALYPASVVVSNSALVNYTFTGSGGIAGSVGLIKTNSGKVTILATNTYTGPTVIGGGTISVASLPNGGVASPLGAASNNSTNLQFAGGILAYTGPSTGTDRGLTLNAPGGTIDVVGGTVLTNNGIIAGTGVLGLTDAGSVVLPVANTYSGGTTISGGLVVQPLNNTSFGTGTITNNGGTILLTNLAGNTFANNLWVTGTSIIDQNNYAGSDVFNGTLGGNGTLIITNLAFTSSSVYSTFTLGGSMAAFSGKLVFAPVSSTGSPNTGFLRLNSGATVSNTGSTNASFNLGDSPSQVILTTRNAETVDVGELKGGPGTQVEGPRNAGTTVWSVGGLNTSTTFAGSIVDKDLITTGENTNNSLFAALTKVGTGTLTLTGTNGYSGGTIVSNGTLLVNGGIYNGTNDGPITVSGGTLGGVGIIGGAVTVQSGGTLAPGAGTNVAGTVLTLNSNLTVQTGGTVQMQVSHSANDSITCSGTITYGGMLMIATNAGDATPYHAGDRFTLFNLGVVSGTYGAGSSFVTIQPPPGLGLGWSGSSLTTDGSIQVVTASPVVAGFTAGPTTGMAPLGVTFTNSSTGASYWVWNFGDGSALSTNVNANVSHTYANVGSYTVTLTAYGTGGVSALTNTAYIVVANAPVAGFSGTPTNIFVGQGVKFTDASTGSITNWVWSFGDGHSVTNTSSISVTNTYAAAGTYTVSLTVTGSGGTGTSTRTSYVTVKPKTALGGVTLAGGKLVFSGANGPAGQQYRILTAANVALPLASWTPVWTNVFAADGSYSYTNTLGTNAASYFLLVSP